ncbi:hypothetical protein [Wolbachia endosymbiont (group A) of Sphaerophoria taeniata]|uniref:hypothetical protein n=1 Tax=Wolbachia endosymbiont (group A) of Sphaerophoria taeniata TaxID=2954057 RepID=UPI0022271660|nr:hypothetical protein [Wolbachia endosymbiont (group A) of Sphaerophoria taeniata]
MNKHLRVTSASRVSSQCVTLGSSLYYAVTWLKLSLLDPSAPMMSFQRVTLESSSYCTFTWCRVKFPGSQCLGTGMTS